MFDQGNTGESGGRRCSISASLQNKESTSRCVGYNENKFLFSYNTFQFIICKINAVFERIKI